MVEINAGQEPSFFSSSSDLQKLFQAMPMLHRDKAQTIIYQGDEIKHFFYIKSGYVKVYNITDDGEERTLLIKKPGDLFPLLKDPDKPGYASPYFFGAMTAAEIGTIKQTDFLEAASKSREGAWGLLRYMSEFSSQLTDRLSQIENKTAEGKLENLLPYLKNVCGKQTRDGSWRLELRLTHQGLASLLGMARETVSREIQGLVKRGTIKYQNGHIVISENAAKFKD